MGGRPRRGAPSPVLWAIPLPSRSRDLPPDPARWAPLPCPPSLQPHPASPPSLSRPSLRAPRCAPGTPPQPLGIGPLIRRMNKSQRLLKRRAVLSAVIKWCVSAEEGAIKTVWEEGRVRKALRCRGADTPAGPEGPADNGTKGGSAEAQLPPADRARCVPGARGLAEVLGWRGRGRGERGTQAAVALSASRLGVGTETEVCLVGGTCWKDPSRGSTEAAPCPARSS